MKRTPDKLPNPWLFDSEKLLRELDRCREMVLLIPAPTHETHFAINIAVSAIWDLRDNLRYLLSLHRDMQRDFVKKAHRLSAGLPETDKAVPQKGASLKPRQTNHTKATHPNGPSSAATHA